MARNWMVNPIIHCDKHILGAHNECHTVLGILRKGNRIDGYIKNDCIEILSLKHYHDILVQDFKRRNWNHYSPLHIYEQDYSHLPTQYIYHKIDRHKSLDLLLSRCEKCKENFFNLLYTNKYTLEYFFI